MSITYEESIQLSDQAFKESHPHLPELPHFQSELSRRDWIKGILFGGTALAWGKLTQMQMIGKEPRVPTEYNPPADRIVKIDSPCNITVLGDLHSYIMNDDTTNMIPKTIERLQEAIVGSDMVIVNGDGTDGSIQRNIHTTLTSPEHRAIMSVFDGVRKVFVAGNHDPFEEVLIELKQAHEDIEIAETVLGPNFMILHGHRQVTPPVGEDEEINKSPEDLERAERIKDRNSGHVSRLANTGVGTWLNYAPLWLLSGNFKSHIITLDDAMIADTERLQRKYGVDSFVFGHSHTERIYHGENRRSVWNPGAFLEPVLVPGKFKCLKITEAGDMFIYDTETGREYRQDYYHTPDFREGIYHPTQTERMKSPLSRIVERFVNKNPRITQQLVAA